LDAFVEFWRVFEFDALNSTRYLSVGNVSEAPKVPPFTFGY